ncbi:MAG: FAD-dependent oxidoreductase, partial [Rhodospirillaceae bacterium]|nr:FAD-dependent oxidoreductase [Rhodospirillaceae bacterium]
MPFSLLKFALKKDGQMPRALPTPSELKPAYDIVIIGGGGHGLATAYYLARDWGITNVAVLEKGYIGGGNTGRNTMVIRSNYLTPAGVKFYDTSVRLYQDLAQDFDMNLMLSKRAQITLAHNDAQMRTMRWRDEVSRHFGIASDLVGIDELRRLVPTMNLSDGVRFPVQGALVHHPGSIARHDAIAWGYGSGAWKRGAEIHQNTTVTGLEIDGANGGRKITGVHTDRGFIKAGQVIQCVAGMSGEVARMAGIKLPIKTFPLQAGVTQPLKRFLDPMISSAQHHVYLSQTSRGEIVVGGGSDPHPLYSTRSTLEMKEAWMVGTLELFPYLAEVKILRQWAGMTDMTPDYSPVMGKSEVKNYYLDAGWGTWGFKATPVCGKTNAELIAKDEVPELIEAFSLERFNTFSLLDDKAATA